MAQRQALPDRIDWHARGNVPPLVPKKWIPTPDEGSTRPRLDPALRDELLASVPNLRAFAFYLSGSFDRTDDLVQETLVRALAHIKSFEPGTNMLAWLFTILRNQYRSEYRKRRHEARDRDGKYANTLKSNPVQIERIQVNELHTALGKLSAERREALILVGAAGFSTDGAAAICSCPAGTIKSRMNRARVRLAQILAVDSVDDFGPDNTTRAVLVGNARS